MKSTYTTRYSYIIYSENCSEFLVNFLRGNEFVCMQKIRPLKIYTNYYLLINRAMLDTGLLYTCFEGLDHNVTSHLFHGILTQRYFTPVSWD